MTVVNQVRNHNQLRYYANVAVTTWACAAEIASHREAVYRSGW